MDASTNFSLRFAQAPESKARVPKVLTKRQALERTVTGLSLISQAPGLGMLIIANRHRADLNDFAGGSLLRWLPVLGLFYWALGYGTKIRHI